MTATTGNVLAEDFITVTTPAQTKIVDLIGQVEEDIQGVRVYATPGGCSGISFGMTFTDQIAEDDNVLECEGFKIIIDTGALPHLRGVEIDYVDRGDGTSVFKFNNVQPVDQSACGGCPSASSCG
ncbi:MAG TPA: iron-sulfur cluster assembly accessory protein [Sedimenticola sp.]|nr:iron-sulfur cluster assembly accessory protein [Sedimenticola sp.]